MNPLSRLLTSSRQLDLLWQADAHEEAGEGLGEVLSVGRAEAEAVAGVGGSWVENWSGVRGLGTIRGSPGFPAPGSSGEHEEEVVS